MAKPLNSGIDQWPKRRIGPYHPVGCLLVTPNQPSGSHRCSNLSSSRKPENRADATSYCGLISVEGARRPTLHMQKILESIPIDLLLAGEYSPSCMSNSMQACDLTRHTAYDSLSTVHQLKTTVQDQDEERQRKNQLVLHGARCSTCSTSGCREG